MKYQKQFLKLQFFPNSNLNKKKGKLSIKENIKHFETIYKNGKIM